MSWIGARVTDLESPCMVLDLDRVEANIERVQDFATRHGARYRPHTKTHKMPAVAHKQLAAGAAGITVAKLGEAEVMAAAGIRDIFMANQVVGATKVRRLRALAREIRIAVGIDAFEQAEPLSEAFRTETRPLQVLVEVDVGAGRSGVPPGDAAVELAERVQRLPGLDVAGIFTHEGHDYHARDREDVAAIAREAQQTMLDTARAVEGVLGRSCFISIGSTPSMLVGILLPGIHELRAGTCIFYDASMANIIGHHEWCAASVLATVTGAPSRDRRVADAGAKALSIDRRTGGLLGTPGFGHIVGHEDLVVTGLSDEHAVIKRADGGQPPLSIGARIQIIPNHICPAVNLTDYVFAARRGAVEAIWPVAARGRTR